MDHAISFVFFFFGCPGSSLQCMGPSSCGALTLLQAGAVVSTQALELWHVRLVAPRPLGSQLPIQGSNLHPLH